MVVTRFVLLSPITGKHLHGIGKITKIKCLAEGTMSCGKMVPLQGYFYDKNFAYDALDAYNSYPLTYYSMDWNTNYLYEASVIKKGTEIIFSANDEICDMITVSDGYFYVEYEVEKNEEVLEIVIEANSIPSTLTNIYVDWAHINGTITVDYGDGTIVHAEATTQSLLLDHEYADKNEYVVKIYNDENFPLGIRLEQPDLFQIKSIKPTSQMMAIYADLLWGVSRPFLNIDALPQTLRYLKLKSDNGILSVSGNLHKLPKSIQSLWMYDITGYYGNFGDLPWSTATNIYVADNRSTIFDGGIPDSLNIGENLKACIITGEPTTGWEETEIIPKIVTMAQKSNIPTNNGMGWMNISVAGYDMTDVATIFLAKNWQWGEP